VPFATVEYPQSNDRYRPVSVTAEVGCAAAYSAAPVTRLLAPAVPAAAGAVPRTATLPVTHPSQLVPSATVVACHDVGHDPAEDGSPITTAANPWNVAWLIDSSVLTKSCVTV
jgi:hypothetical protein